MIKKKLIGTFLILFGILMSGFAYAGSSGGFGSSTSSQFDVSIDKVSLNNHVVSQSKNNLLADADAFSVQVDITAVKTLDKGHVEVSLRGRQSNDAVADSTPVFDLLSNQSTTKSLLLSLTDGLKREDDFELVVKVVDAKGRSEQKTYGVRTKQTTGIRIDALDVSIDRVIVNKQVVAESKANFIEESNDFDVLVEFTSLEDVDFAHVEVALKDLNSGHVVADASPTFDLFQDDKNSVLLKLKLLDKLKQSDSFELTVRVRDAEGNSVQKIYGIRMRDGLAGTRFLDISIDNVDIENKAVAENENNFVVIDNNKKDIDVKVRLTSLEEVKNAHIDAILSFENGDVVADVTTNFNIGKDQTVVKQLELPLIGRFKQNSFKLKIKVVDAENDVEEKVYGLRISQQKFPFVINGISLNPETNAQAGKFVSVELSFKNSGVVPLDNINVRVGIPEFGISSTKFASQIENNDMSNKLTEEFMLKIPEDAQTGTYTVKAEVFSQLGGQNEVAEIPVFVVGKSDQIKPIAGEKVVINVPILKQNVKNDGSEVIFPITLTNKGHEAETYTLLLDGLNWADLRLTESNVFVIKPQESKTINVYASTKTKTMGEQAFSVTIKNNDKVLSQVLLKGNVVLSDRTVFGLKGFFEALLIVVAIALVAFGIFAGVKDYMSKNNDKEIDKGIVSEMPDKSEVETYY